MKKKKYEESNDKSRTAIHSQNGIRAGVTVFLLTLLAACGADDNTRTCRRRHSSGLRCVRRPGRQPCGRDYCFQPFLHGGVCLLYRQQQSEHFGQAQLHVQPKGGANQQCISWTYSPVKYWPNNPADKVSFYAYGPYAPKGLNVSGTTQSGPPTMEYTIQGAEADQADLVIAARCRTKRMRATTER